MTSFKLFYEIFTSKPIVVSNKNFYQVLTQVGISTNEFTLFLNNLGGISMQTSGIFVKENTENTKRHIVNIQWLIDDETKKKYYDDLGIIGEISPEPKKRQNCLKLAPVDLSRNYSRDRSSKISIPDVRKAREKRRIKQNNQKSGESVYRGKKLFSDPVVKVCK